VAKALTTYNPSKTPTFQLTEGLNISLDIRAHDEKNSKKTLSLLSEVVEVYPNRTFMIRMPTLQDSLYPLPHHQMILLYFMAKAEQGGIPETFAVPVRYLERIERNGRVYAKMEPLGEIERSQRRDSYRLSLAINVSLRRSGQHDTLMLFASLINFGEGGMLLATDEPLCLNETIALEFDIGEQEAVEGVVVRVEHTPDAKHQYQVAIQFIGADREQTDRFAQYIEDHRD
jgi:c-di-GMP-binding flagellar brake protein YcgR